MFRLCDKTPDPDEAMLPAEQHWGGQAQCGAAVQAGAGYLPLLEGGQTVPDPALHHKGTAAVLVRQFNLKFKSFIVRCTEQHRVRLGTEIL